MWYNKGNFREYIRWCVCVDMERFTEQIKSLSVRVNKLKGTLATEEATKTALIMPFFQVLGYDVFNPLEFSPEYVADVGIKKGEKVDYAILEDGLPVILVECKAVNEDLAKHGSQLFRYYGATSAKYAILTNGIEYWFYTDLEEKNKMDKMPFLYFNLEDLNDMVIAEVHKFTKGVFDEAKISRGAYELKYVHSLKNFLKEQINEPSEGFVKYLLSEVYDGVKTKNTIERFTPVVKKTFRSFINDEVNKKLSDALSTTVEVEEDEQQVEEVVEDTVNEKEVPEIITTAEEIESYVIVRMMLKDKVLPERITYRDNHSYFNILLDNTIRKWLLRVYMNGRKKYLVLNGVEGKFEIDKPIDIMKYQEEIEKVVDMFLK